MSHRGSRGAFRPAVTPLEGRVVPAALGTTRLAEGPAAGSDSVIVSAAGDWTATAGAGWLHTASAGTGDGLATFTFDANPGAARTGTLTVAGQTLTVTQAGRTSIPASVTTLAAAGLNQPGGVAVDGSGNVYVADTGDNAIREWNASTRTLTTLVASGLNGPLAVAVDGSGNVYISDTGNKAIKEWNASTGAVATLVSGLGYPGGVAVDPAGNVYFFDADVGTIQEWTASTRTVTTLVSGLTSPSGVAVDGSGNVYFGDLERGPPRTGWVTGALKEWNASTHAVTTLVDLVVPFDVAVDGSGNVYFVDEALPVKKWSASTQVVTTLSDVSPRGLVGALAVDGSGNVYLAYSDGTLNERPRAFVSAGPFAVGGADGTVRLLDADGTLVSTVRPIPGYTGLVEVAGGDFNGDGTPDLAVAAARSRGVAGLTAATAGRVFVYDGAAAAAGALTLVHTFRPFATSDGPGGTAGVYTNGLNIAAGDVNGDGRVDLIAGTRGRAGGFGTVEYGRLVVVSAGAAADGSGDTALGPVVTPFGPGYQKGVVVAAGNLDGAGGDEVAVTRGGPAASADPAVQAVKVKAYRFAGGRLRELNLSGTGRPLAPFAGVTGALGGVLRANARVAFVADPGGGRDDLVVAVLDDLSALGDPRVRVATFAVDSATGRAMASGPGPLGGQVDVGAHIQDYAIARASAAGGGAADLVLITRSATPQVQYLDPLSGAVLGGFELPVPGGGVSIDGI